jgi:hypothetical protein
MTLIYTGLFCFVFSAFYLFCPLSGRIIEPEVGRLFDEEELLALLLLFEFGCCFELEFEVLLVNLVSTFLLLVSYAFESITLALGCSS